MVTNLRNRIKYLDDDDLRFKLSTQDNSCLIKLEKMCLSNLLSLIAFRIIHGDRN